MVMGPINSSRRVNVSSCKQYFRLYHFHLVKCFIEKPVVKLLPTYIIISLNSQLKRMVNINNCYTTLDRHHIHVSHLRK